MDQKGQNSTRINLLNSVLQKSTHNHEANFSISGLSPHRTLWRMRIFEDRLPFRSRRRILKQRLVLVQSKWTFSFHWIRKPLVHLLCLRSKLFNWKNVNFFSRPISQKPHFHCTISCYVRSSRSLVTSFPSFSLLIWQTLWLISYKQDPTKGWSMKKVSRWCIYSCGRKRSRSSCSSLLSIISKFSGNLQSKTLTIRRTKSLPYCHNRSGKNSFLS